MTRFEICIASNPQFTINSADARGAPFPKLERGQTYTFDIALNIQDTSFSDPRFPFSIQVSNPRFTGTCVGDIYLYKRYDAPVFLSYDFTPPSTIIPVTLPQFPYSLPPLGNLVDDTNWVSVIMQVIVTIPEGTPVGSYQLTYADATLSTNYPVPLSLEVTEAATNGSPINPIYIVAAIAVAGIAIFALWYWNNHKHKRQSEPLSEYYEAR